MSGSILKSSRIKQNFEYDSWNRIRQMKYPDGEVLTYGYDAAGQLISMVSKKDNTRYTLLEDMRYDQYGNVTYKKYGNGTESNYTYDPKRQHLTSMVATNSQGEFINAAYTYDKVDNILGIRNTAKPLSTIGGTYSHSYTYDDFSRLVSASGTCSKGVSYELDMQYDVMSNPLRKKQTVKGSAVATSHDLEFTYDGDKPNAASKIGNESYTYDLNGNPTLIEGDTTYREMVWNEENRLMILSDADYVSRYTYDYTGNRVIKSHGPMTTIYINGVLQGVDMHDDENYTLYVSPYMTVNADRFTKYYYAGTQRIASKLGSGKFDNVYGVNGFHLTAGGKDYAERSVQMVKGVQDYYRQAGVTPGVPNQQGQHANPYISGVAYPNVPLGDYSVPSGWPGPVARRQQGQVFGPPVSFLREAPQEAKAGVGFKSDHQREDNLFYFHSDHLGSTSYLTDTAGNVSQFVWYAPYGEALVDEHTTTYENPFKFSGKELDDITGLYDHGARNRNPITAVWYGIDELFEKYPENGPYSYCGGNPVRFVDLDGREIEKNSLQEWKQNVEAIENRKNELSQQLVKLESSSNLSRRMKKESYLLRERITFLDVKLNNLKAMEEDNKTIISLNKLPENQDGNNMGWIEKKDGRIIVNYYNTENFVHETTHITQFMEGNLAFSIDGMVVARDIYDEIHAYMMQCAYSDEQYLSDITPTFVKKLPSPSRSFYTNKNGYSNLPLGADTPGFILKRGFSDSPEMIKSYFPFNTLKEQFRGQWEFYVK